MLTRIVEIKQSSDPERQKQKTKHKKSDPINKKDSTSIYMMTLCNTNEKRSLKETKKR